MWLSHPSHPILSPRPPPLRECLQGLGAEVFSRAARLLEDLDPEEAESVLTALLGQDNYEAFAGKLQELKLCEESLDGL